VPGVSGTPVAGPTTISVGRPTSMHAPESRDADVNHPLLHELRQPNPADNIAAARTTIDTRRSMMNSPHEPHAVPVRRERFAADGTWNLS
jgi:hypothetical protein